VTEEALHRFATDYAAHRKAEGRDHAGEDLFALPYLQTGPLARQWAVRARSYDALMARVIRPLAAAAGRPLRIIDLGAGNGWLSYRLVAAGHAAVALDFRDDGIDGLGAAQPLAEHSGGRMERLVAVFEDIPLPSASFDAAIFNASLHYAFDLTDALEEAGRVVRPGGRLVIMDSPVYRREADGLAMVSEKQSGADEQFGARASNLMSLPFIEFLTRERLARASQSLGLAWRRIRIVYPLWYEARPLAAMLRRRRPPSRFDLWVSLRP
jgi:SAM-dependent methyltransferase